MIEGIGQHEDNKSYIAVKKCRMLRSGVQYYLKEEVPQSLLDELPLEVRNKKFFSVYRKPEAIIKHLSDFNCDPNWMMLVPFALLMAMVIGLGLWGGPLVSFLKDVAAGVTF